MLSFPAPHRECLFATEALSHATETISLSLRDAVSVAQRQCLSPEETLFCATKRTPLCHRGVLCVTEASSLCHRDSVYAVPVWAGMRAESRTSLKSLDFAQPPFLILTHIHSLCVSLSLSLSLSHTPKIITPRCGVGCKGGFQKCFERGPYGPCRAQNQQASRREPSIVYSPRFVFVVGRPEG